MKYKFEIKRNKKGEFTAKVYHRNGKLIINTPEGYKRQATLLRVLNNLFKFIENNSIQWTKPKKLR